jgi:integrase/recombinase XerD
MSGHAALGTFRGLRGARMDRHAAARRLRRLAPTAGVPITTPPPPGRAFVTAMLDAGAGVREVHIAARHAGPPTPMRDGRARHNPGRHPSCIRAAGRACGAGPKRASGAGSPPATARQCR